MMRLNSECVSVPFTTLIITSAARAVNHVRGPRFPAPGPLFHQNPGGDHFSKQNEWCKSGKLFKYGRFSKKTLKLGSMGHENHLKSLVRTHSYDFFSQCGVILAKFGIKGAGKGGLKPPSSLKEFYRGFALVALSREVEAYTGTRIIFRLNQ